MMNFQNNSNIPILSSWWLALRWVVATFSVLIALALAGSFVPYERVIAQGHPWLPPKTCTGCMMCGMTRAFCAMSSGRWGEAADLNPLGPFAYCLCWGWILLCLLFVLRAGYKMSGKRWEFHVIRHAARHFRAATGSKPAAH